MSKPRQLPRPRLGFYLCNFSAPCAHFWKLALPGFRAVNPAAMPQPFDNSRLASHCRHCKPSNAT